MPLFERIVIIVLDGVGVGAMPDADEYGDEGSATLQNIYRECGGLDLPNMAGMGLGKVVNLDLGGEVKQGAYGKCALASVGKDSTTGHWEMMGLITEKPFPVFPQGFPEGLVSDIERESGRKIIGNRPASGTKIIDELGEEHIKTGDLIVYTSADSVLQIASHEDIIPVDELYEICRKARDLCKGECAVGRVIARPFVGNPGSFTRTPRRKDFSLPPPEKTALDILVENGYEIKCVGKLDDIFARRGIPTCIHTKNNNDGMDKILQLIKNEKWCGILFSNLIDFDMMWGHRNDIKGFAEGLVEFDRFLPQLLASLGDDDMLILVSDHGNDPTTESTDHSREYCLLLVWHNKLRGGINLGTRDTLSDVGATVVDNFGIKADIDGCSFLKELT